VADPIAISSDKSGDAIATTLKRDGVTSALDWHIVQSEYVLADQWLCLRSDICTTASGQTVSPYYVLECPDWVNIVAFTQDDKIILTNEYRHGLGKVCLGLPGGIIDPGDSGAEAAARRELLEETGFGALELRPLLRMSIDPSRQTNFGHSYLATGCSFEQPNHDADVEGIESVFLDFGSFLHLALGHELTLCGFDFASLSRAIFFLIGTRDPRLSGLKNSAISALGETCGYAR
jgi:8-oxo-dGTP pyrophosphatase MutT (NUDIX family)